MLYELDFNEKSYLTWAMRNRMTFEDAWVEGWEPSIVFNHGVVPANPAEAAAIRAAAVTNWNRSLGAARKITDKFTGALRVTNDEEKALAITYDTYGFSDSASRIIRSLVERSLSVVSAGTVGVRA